MYTNLSDIVSRFIRRMTIAFAAFILSLPGLSHAAPVDVFFGYNHSGSSASVMELRSITYTYQINGPPQIATLNLPSFEDWSGMPDGRTSASEMSSGKTYCQDGCGTSGPGSYGETTRTIGQMVTINWSDFTGSEPFPHIYINSFTYSSSKGGTEYVGTFSTGNLYDGYLLGLIDDGVNTELLSNDAPPRSDIYTAAYNGTIGNPAVAYSSSNPLGAGAIIFSASTTPTPASTVPVPAAVWLFGSALGLMGWMRRKA